MPLPPPAEREHLHNRDIACRGFRRRDGMYDIEGHIRDTKTYDFTSKERGEVTAGMSVHDMWVRLTIDTEFVVRDVEAVTEAGPFRVCPEAAPNYKRLVGLKIGAGWRRKAAERIGHGNNCTHITELLPVLATVAFQTIQVDRMRRGEKGSVLSRSDGKPYLMDSCLAFREDGPKAHEMWPEYFEKIDAPKT